MHIDEKSRIISLYGSLGLKTPDIDSMFTDDEMRKLCISLKIESLEVSENLRDELRYICYLPYLSSKNNNRNELFLSPAKIKKMSKDQLKNVENLKSYLSEPRNQFSLEYLYQISRPQDESSWSVFLSDILNNLSTLEKVLDDHHRIGNSKTGAHHEDRNGLIHNLVQTASRFVSVLPKSNYDQLENQGRGGLFSFIKAAIKIIDPKFPINDSGLSKKINDFKKQIGNKPINS